MFKLQGTQLNLSLAYHPQLDGQTKCFNQCLQCYLHCFCSLKPSKWCKWIPWAMYWHNTTWRSSTGFTPYEIVYDRPPPTLLQYVPTTAKVQAVEDYLYNRDRVKKLLMDNLVKARDRMKSFAYRHRTERHFEVAERVLLKLQPYRQKTVRWALPQKMSSKYFSPYTILEKIGTIVCHLQLPSAIIHDVFNVSQFKKYEGGSVQIQHVPPVF